MFLATTALSEFWDKDQEILFLGAWCLLYDRRSEWEGLKYQVMPSPWCDRKRFYDAAQYLDEYGERMLDYLNEYLNSAHNVSYSRRYWRILIGPWLLHYLHAVYDRFVHLTEALNRYPNLHTIVLDPLSFRAPRDTKEFMAFVLDDPYNLQIFSQLLVGMGHAFPQRTFRSGWPESRNGMTNVGIRGLAKHVAKFGLGRACRIVGLIKRNRWRVELCDLGCHPSQMWNLAWRANFQTTLYDSERGWSFTIADFLFDDRRKRLGGFPASNEFERILIRSLPQSFPALYLEAYRDARNETLSNARRFPAVIVSASNWYANEPFKFLAAEASAHGSRLVTVQLGGGYGIHRFSAPELHERRLGDAFMTWGWADKKTERCKNLPSPKVSSLIPSDYINRANQKAETILFVSTAHLRYLLRFHSFPVGVQSQEYFQWQLRFLASISHRIFRRLRFRTYPADYGHATREQIAGQFPMIQWDDKSSFYASLQNAQLAVFDHSGTSFLEALVSNIPSILFWDPRWSEVREEAEPYFEDLRRVGILWDSPEEAAQKIEEVYEDPWPWWNHQTVQKARCQFVDRYALTRKDWIDCWAKALDEELAMSELRKT